MSDPTRDRLATLLVEAQQGGYVCEIPETVVADRLIAAGVRLDTMGRDAPGDAGKDERTWTTPAASQPSTTITRSPESGMGRRLPDSMARTPEPSSSKSSPRGSTARSAVGSETFPRSEIQGDGGESLSPAALPSHGPCIPSLDDD